MANDPSAAVVSVRVLFPPGEHLVSLGPVHHLFAYYYREPIQLQKLSHRRAPASTKANYFCYVEDPKFRRPYIPFAWDPIADISCGSGAVRASADKSRGWQAPGESCARRRRIGFRALCVVKHRTGRLSRGPDGRQRSSLAVLRDLESVCCQPSTPGSRVNLARGGQRLRRVRHPGRGPSSSKNRDAHGGRRDLHEHSWRNELGDDRGAVRRVRARRIPGDNDALGRSVRGDDAHGIRCHVRQRAEPGP